MFQNLLNYQPADPTLWQGREDTLHQERFFQKIEFIHDEKELVSTEKKTVFIGFASDTGIIRNQGRPGAKEGPNQLKAQLAKLPCHKHHRYIDLGSIVCEGDNLEAAQTELGQLVHFCQQHGHQTVVLGGGHEVAWGHFQGLTKHYPKLGIINFDAHFDLRPVPDSLLGNSGTPFSQIAAHCQTHALPFHYCCIGIQTFGNTPSLFERAKELNVRYLKAEQLFERSLAWQFAFIDEFILNLDHIYLSICMDVFAEAFAPGVSAPQTLGLTPWQVIPLLKYIVQSGKVVSLDIAELSPPLDQNQKTARLAAMIIAELLDTN